MWKNQLDQLINCFELQLLIDPSIKQPETTIICKDCKEGIEEIPNLEFAIWWRKDQLLKNWLLSSLSVQVIPNTIGLSTLTEVWEALQTTCGAPMEARLVQLNIQLQSLRRNDLPFTVSSTSEAHRMLQVILYYLLMTSLILCGCFH